MNEVIRVRDEYYILATSSLADARTRVLKHGDAFAVFDRYGDIQPVGMGEQGLYFEGTRFLSRLSLSLDKVRPLLLNSTVREDNTLFAVELTNPDAKIGGDERVPRDTLQISRAKFLWQGAYYERVIVRNYGLAPIDATLSVGFDADFSDIFEVRGMRREKKGQRTETAVDETSVVLTYRGASSISASATRQPSSRMTPSTKRRRPWPGTASTAEQAISAAA